MNVLVLGATGAAGRSAVPALVRAGHPVTAHARSEEMAERLPALGARLVPGHADDTEQLSTWQPGADAAVDLRVRVRPCFPRRRRKVAHGLRR